MARPLAFCWLSYYVCVVLIFPNPLLSSFAQSSLSLFAMPKVNPRNEVGAIIHAISNRVPGDHATKNIYGNVNYAKMILQGTVVNLFGGRAPGGKNAVWKLTVRLQDAHRRTCTRSQIEEGCCPSTALHPRAGSSELNQLACAGAVSDCLRISVASSLPCSRLAVTSPPPSPAILTKAKYWSIKFTFLPSSVNSN